MPVGLNFIYGECFFIDNQWVTSKHDFTRFIDVIFIETTDTNTLSEEARDADIAGDWRKPYRVQYSDIEGRETITVTSRMNEFIPRDSDLAISSQLLNTEPA
jgi:hypothetical protein